MCWFCVATVTNYPRPTGLKQHNFVIFVQTSLSQKSETGLTKLKSYCQQDCIPSTNSSCQVTSVVSDSVRPHRQQPTRLPRPWDSPGKNTGVGCHFLLQCMKVKSQSEVTQSCPTLSDPMDCSPPGSSVHGIFQARVLEWGAIAFSTQTLEKNPFLFQLLGATRILWLTDSFYLQSQQQPIQPFSSCICCTGFPLPLIRTLQIMMGPPDIPEHCPVSKSAD